MSERIIGEGWWTRFELDELERRAFAAGKMEHDAALREAVDHIKHLLGEYDENTKSVCKDCRAARAFLEKHKEGKEQG